MKHQEKLSLAITDFIHEAQALKVRINSPKYPPGPEIVARYQTLRDVLAKLHPLIIPNED